MPAALVPEYEDGEIEPHAPPSRNGRQLPADDSDEDSLGHKRKHKKKDKDREKDKDERAPKRHKEKKHKKHKKEKDDEDSDDDVKVNGVHKNLDKDERDSSPRPREEPRRVSPPARARSQDRSPQQRDRGSGRRSRSPRRNRSRSPDRRRSPPRRSPPRRGRSPPRRGYGYNDRGRGGGYRDGRRDDRGRNNDRQRITEERRQDELRKEKERAEQEAIRKKKEEEDYAKSVAQQFEQMTKDGDIGDDGDFEFEDEEEKAERERKERKERMERIKAAAERKAEEKAAEIKAEEEERKKNGTNTGNNSPNLSIATDEDKPDSQVDLLDAITPRARGAEDSEEEEEEDIRAGDVDELTEGGDERARASGLSPKKKGSHELEAEKVYDIFDKSDEVAEAQKVKAIARGDDKMLADNFDDKEGYLTFQMGELFNDRYEVKRVLGKGVFSTVLGAQDMRYPVEQTKDKKPVNVAIKIIRNNDMMAKCGAKELEFLKLLAKDGGAEKHHIVQLSDDFVHHGHMCLVFEPMAMNLREVIKKFGHNRGINIEGVQVFAKQMFQALKHLRKCKIVHADIKPDNILINERHNAIKVCDFGSGSYINECDITPYLVSRWYRAPEITLCLKYDYSIDLWSIACCLYELYTGKVMFPGNSNNDMLRRFMEIKGRFPNKLIKRSMQKMIELGRPVDFTEDFKFMRIMIDKITKKETVKIITIDEKPVKDLMKLLMPTTLQPDQARKVKQLADLLHNALALNPDNRNTIEACLHHPFIKEPFGFVPKRREQPVTATV